MASAQSIQVIHDLRLRSTVVTGTSSQWFCRLVAAPGPVLSSQMTLGIIFLHLVSKQKRTEVVPRRRDKIRPRRSKQNKT